MSEEVEAAADIAADAERARARATTTKTAEIIDSASSAPRLERRRIVNRGSLEANVLSTPRAREKAGRDLRARESPRFDLTRGWVMRKREKLD